MKTELSDADLDGMDLTQLRALLARITREIENRKGSVITES
jgi:hypothetical protein